MTFIVSQLPQFAPALRQIRASVRRANQHLSSTPLEPARSGTDHPASSGYGADVRPKTTNRRARAAGRLHPHS